MDTRDPRGVQKTYLEMRLVKPNQEPIKNGITPDEVKDLEGEALDITSLGRMYDTLQIDRKGGKYRAILRSGDIMSEYKGTAANVSQDINKALGL